MRIDTRPSEAVGYLQNQSQVSHSQARIQTVVKSDRLPTVGYANEKIRALELLGLKFTIAA